jgi:nucleotide-binding universal stress UspA family protein
MRTDEVSRCTARVTRSSRREAAGTDVRGPTVLLGYAESSVTVAATAAAAQLLPGARAYVAHLWRAQTHPVELRRLAIQAGSVDVLARELDEAGMTHAADVAASGVALASALGWSAEAVPRRCFGDPGDALVRLAAELRPDVVVGSHGRRGARAVLDSVSDVVAHRSGRPVLVVPAVLRADYFACAADGPAIVGWDGSEGAAAALATTGMLFPDRQRIAAEVGSPPPDDRPDRTDRVAHRARGRDGQDVDVVQVALPAGLPQSRAVARALGEFADERQAALLVVGSRRRAAVVEILLGSVAMATLHQADVPVLVTPPDHHVR